jgi:hypothetical protein
MCVQERAAREIRMRRAIWRELDNSVLRTQYDDMPISVSSHLEQNILCLWMESCNQRNWRTITNG